MGSFSVLRSRVNKRIKVIYADVACVASVSNRVIARKLERKQKKVEGGGGGEPPPSFIFFALVPAFDSFLDEPREETLATQAKLNEDLNFLLCCAIDDGERPSVNLFTSRF